MRDVAKYRHSTLETPKLRIPYAKSNIHRGNDDVPVASHAGADLAALAREAALCAVRRVDANAHAPDANAHVSDEAPTETATPVAWTGQLPEEKVMMSDFASAMRGMVASARRGDVVAVQHTTWEDIGGLGHVKEQLEYCGTIVGGSIANLCFDPCSCTALFEQHVFFAERCNAMPGNSLLICPIVPR